MKKHSEDENNLLNKIMGLGEKSMRKSYYPELQKQIRELEKTNEQLRQHIEEKEQAQKAIAENEALLADIINYQATGTYRTRIDKDCDLSLGAENPFTFDFISTKLLEITGMEETREFYRNPLMILENVHPDDKALLIKNNDLAIKQFTSFKWEGRMIVDGKEKWVHMESHPRLLGNGDRVWTGILMDLTARKKSEEELRISEERFRLIFDNSPVGIISYDEKGIIKACNRHFAEIMNTDISNLLGQNALFLPDKNLLKTFRKALRGKKSVYEGGITPSPGAERVAVRMQFAPIFDTDRTVRGGVGIIENFSERIRNEKLEQEIIIARKSAEFKQNFLANMSHEIRTPLTGIEGMAHILLNTPLSEVQQDYLDTIVSSSRSLRAIINQILDFSKIEAGHMLPKERPFHISLFLNKVKKIMASLCTSEIPFTMETSAHLPECIMADEQKILQIVANYISNAVKYAPEGLITFRMTQMASTRDGNLRFKITVSDEGPGISEEKQKDLFSPFSQLERHDMRAVEGTGLGLSISRELAAILGGNTGVNSTPGKGSDFWFTFIAALHGQILPKTLKPLLLSHDIKLNILLVEDKKINQKVIRLILENMGHDITLADNGQMALELFNPGIFDLILMDIQMPVMDGITATRMLRERHKKTVPPIIGLSANAFEGDREKYMNMGMDDYLTKPVSTDDFNQLLANWFM
jgi:two-component system, OmpR family, aerobic respiration control sensor histidine kinase ArcB